MLDRDFLRDLVRRTFTEWRGPPNVGGQAVLAPTWLSVHDVLDTIKRHGTQLPGVGKDQINRVTEEQLFDVLRSMREVRVRGLNAPDEAFRWLG